METKAGWIAAERVREALQLEPVFFLIALGVSSYLFYSLFLKDLSVERHRNLKNLFKNLGFHASLGTILVLGYLALDHWLDAAHPLRRLVPTLGLVAIISLCVAFTKICRIIAFEYLFFRSMRTGVPLLLINLLSLFLSVVLALWVLSGIFQVQVAPLLATSAIFSIVLGLALQDTLGNLLAGVALALDKPYSIGDWIEVYNGPQKWVGQVTEITWRAAILVGIMEEVITIPNRIMAQSQVSNYAGKERPFLRSQMYRLNYGAPLDKIRPVIKQAVLAVPGVRNFPEPQILFWESMESYILIKVIYSIYDFGAQYIVADQVHEAVVNSLAQLQLQPAPARLHIEKTSV